jgi:TRAP-type C4-dicarboxylate transport system substrate-binding protein
MKARVILFTAGRRMRRSAAAEGFGKAVIRLAALVAAQLLAFAVLAEPIHLKLAFYQDRDTAVYRYAIKPFVDSVNAEAQGLLAIDVYAEGALGPGLAEQPRLVLDGTADIAFIVPGQTPYRFPDNKLLELPGLFRDLREGTLTYTRLVAAGKLRGYEDFFTIGAYTTGLNFIHSRKPIESLEALKGQRIRGNNQMEAAVLEALGATPTVLPVPQIADTIRKGAIDGAALAPTALRDYHIAALTPHHYLLGSGVNPLALVMNRKKFESLPETVQIIIRKHSGEHAAKLWTDSRDEEAVFASIKADSRQQIIAPSAADAQTARRVFESVTASWTAESPRNLELLKDAHAELAKLRSSK